MKIKNHHNKNPDIFAVYTFVVFIPRYIVKGVKDDISSKTIRI